MIVVVILDMKYTYLCVTMMSVFAGCSVGMALGESVPSPYVASPSGKRLTPAEEAKPAINGPLVVGAVVNKPFLFRIPVSGQKPINLQVTGLPEGVKFDAKNGVISGIVRKSQDFPLKIVAKNQAGSDEQTIELKVGDQISLTPPMGWNSWYCHSELISQDAVLETARQMVESGLADFGWSYVNIDDCWQGERGGPSLALQANARFGDMKKMCDDVHELGLRVGIYSTPWVSTYAGFRGGSSMNEKGDDSALGLPEDKRKQATQIFGRWPSVHQLKLDKTGDYWFFDRDAQQWADWGFDYVKVDWKPNDVPTTERIYKDLKKTDRAIILSLSNAAPFENMKGLIQYANATRTTGDIHDAWGSIKGIGFSQEKWQQFLKPGHWPDPDMLQVGKLGKPNNMNTKFEPTRLSPDEQYTQVSLWALLSAPLLLSCDLSDMDDFTKGLLCNDAVIKVNQDAQASPAKKVLDCDGFQIWTKELSDGSMAMGIFNLNDGKKTLKLDTDILGLAGRNKVTDLWKQKGLGTIVNGWEVEVNPHGVVLLKIEK